MKHTKGKWETVHIKYVDGSGGNCYIENELGNNFITVWGITEEPKANAKLISKAPEIYEVLREIIEKTSAIELNTLMPLCRDNPEFEWAITLGKSLLKEIEDEN